MKLEDFNIFFSFRSLFSSIQDLDLSENPVADKRLLKLIQQCRTKQVLDYVKQHGEDAPKLSGGNGDSSAGANQKSASKMKKSKKSESSDEPKFKFIVQRHTDDTVKVWPATFFVKL